MKKEHAVHYVVGFAVAVAAVVAGVYVYNKFLAAKV